MAATVEDSSTGGGNGTSVTVTRPAGASDGSRLFCILNIRGSYTITSADADMTLRASIDTGGGGFPYLLLYEFTGGTTPGELDTADTSWSFTISSGNNYQWGCFAIAGSDGSYVYQTTDTGTGTTHTATGLTPGAADDLLIGLWGGIDNTGPNTWSSQGGGSMTEFMDDDNGGGTVWPSICGAYEQLASASATGTRAATSSDSLNGAAILMAVSAAATSQNIDPSLLSVTPTFFGPSLTQEVAPSLLSVTPTFFGPEVRHPTYLELVEQFFDGNTGFVHGMDDASGNPVDASVNGIDVDGTVGTLSYSQTGRWSGSSAIGFNYGDSCVHWSTSYAPDVSAAFTCGGWLRVNSFTGDSVNGGGDIQIMNRESWGTNGFRLWARANNGGVLDELRFTNSANFTGATDSYGDLAGEWVHAVGRYNGTDTLDLFVNGTLIATATQTLTAATAHTNIGGGWQGAGGDAVVDFDLDGVFFVEHAMSDAEILELATYDLIYPSLLEITPTFFAPDVYLGGAPSTLTVTPTFFGPTVALAAGPQSIAPSLLDVTPTFFGPGLSLSVSPGLLDVSPTFFAPQLDQRIAPDLLDVTPTFFTPSVGVTQGVEVDGLLDVTPTFFAPSASLQVAPGLLDVTSTFFAPEVKLEVGVGLLDVTPTFFAPSVSMVVGVGLLNVAPTFFVPVVGILHRITHVGGLRVSWSSGSLEAGWGVAQPEVAWVPGPGRANWVSQQPRKN